jgi:hypothetical protein
MKYIKTFESYEPESTSIFNIVVKSRVDEDQQDKLEEIINLYHDEDYQEAHRELRDKKLSWPEYKDHPILRWQVNKGHEIDDKFFSNIEINGNEVISKFSVELPSDWDRGTILEWVEGFHKYRSILPMVTMEKMANKKDYEYLDSYKEVVKNLARNSRVEYEVSKEI